MIFSTGDCYTMREIEPGLYEYVIGACEDLIPYPVAIPIGVALRAAENVLAKAEGRA